MQLRCAFGIPSFNINHPFPPKTLLNERVLTASKMVLSSPMGTGQIWLFKCKGRESVSMELYWPYFQGFLAMWAEACSSIAQGVLVDGMLASGCFLGLLFLLPSESSPTWGRRPACTWMALQSYGPFALCLYIGLETHRPRRDICVFCVVLGL